MVPRHLLSFALALVFGSACTVTPPLTPDDESLVADDSPVFDRSLRNLPTEEIDLSRFWTERVGPRPPVPIHHRTFSDVAAGVRSGVVNIYTRRVVKREFRFGIHPNDILPIRIPVASALLDVIPFQVPLPFHDDGFSLGSGFVVNEGGYVLTNAHVIRNATDVRVVLSEGRREYPAQIVGTDRMTDTALLRMDADIPAQPLPLGNSASLQVGEMVVAVGNPLGLSHTVTSGLVSATERVMPGENAPAIDFIQTDSAINPGSSGGPLLNLYGEVVGINTAIVSEAQLIGFAVPIDVVKSVIPLLIVGEARRGWLGLTIGPDDPEERMQALAHGGVAGVPVESVAESGPAAQAGLLPRDRIVAIQGEQVDDPITLRRQTLGLLAGQQVTLTVLRAGQILELPTTLGRQEAEN